MPPPARDRTLADRALPAPVAASDRSIAALAARIDLLFDISPVNAEAARRAWLDSDRRRDPTFEYRAPSIDPDEYCRELDRVDLSGVDDLNLRRLLAGKLEELRAHAALLEARGTTRFLDLSVALYGTADDELLALARALLDQLPPEPPDVAVVEPEEFAARARDEIARYRHRWPGFEASVTVRPDVPSLMVVRRELFVGVDSWLPEHRVEALVHHEVGTHLLTAVTGATQPLTLLEHGLGGYEETQEALGVLSEHLAGGLDAARLRTLAARALVARRVSDGWTFADTFAELSELGFTDAAAWPIVMRMARGGGFTKDVIYLRGLVELVRYLEGGGAIEPLLAGKLHLDHVAEIEALLAEGVLDPPVLHPRWLTVAGAEERLNRIRAGQAPVARWLEVA